MANVIDVLKERGFIEDLSSEDLRLLAEKPLKVYCGFDPTANSLHVGHLVPMMGLAWFQRFGHTPYAIVGGATGMIGDPSGKSSERVLLDEATIESNLQGIRKNLETILDQNARENKLVILNNYDWFKSFSLVNFLRDVGKYFRVGTMLAKENVRNRMTSEEGMSFTEFCYQLLQGYDFYHLHEKHDVTVQLGGSDQWGNIIAGTDFIRKATGKAAYGVTFPLLTRSDGQKFGKSEKGAVWLSPEKLSPYEFYQYFVKVSDEDVITLMRLLTFMEMDEIHYYQTMLKKPGALPNVAQKRLAEEVTRIVHGESGVKAAIKTTELAAPGAKTALNSAIFEELANEIPTVNASMSDIVDVPLVDFITKMGLQSSKGEVRRLIRNGGVYVNNKRVEEEGHLLSKDDGVEGRWLLLAMGKKNKILVCLSAAL